MSDARETVAAAAARARTIKECWQGTRILFARLGEDAGFIGAAGCALDEFGEE